MWTNIFNKAVQHGAIPLLSPTGFWLSLPAGRDKNPYGHIWVFQKGFKIYSSKIDLIESLCNLISIRSILFTKKLKFIVHDRKWNGSYFTVDPRPPLIVSQSLAYKKDPLEIYTWPIWQMIWISGKMDSANLATKRHYYYPKTENLKGEKVLPSWKYWLECSKTKVL